MEYLVNFLRLSRPALVGILSIALGACVSTPPVGQASGVEVLQTDSLPAPSSPFGLEPQDKVTVTVFGQPDLSGPLQVSGDGTLNFPLVGRIDAQGLDAGALEEVIESRLRGRYVLNPTVTVFVDEAPSRLMYVGGQVRKPGSFGALDGMTLSRAIIVAGGVNDFAKVDDVLITREANGQKYIGVYNIAAISRGNYADPAVYPDDVITVGDSVGRRRLLEILSYVQLFTQPLIAIDRIGL